MNTDPGTPDELAAAVIAGAAAGGITLAPASRIVIDSMGPIVGDHATVHQHFVLPLEPLVWPIRVGIPPRLAVAFQERPGLRRAVEEPLAENGPVTVVVAGDGGTGKTQLAAAVFAGSGDAGFDLRLWIRATSRNELLTAYAEAAGAVRAIPPGSTEADPQRDAAAFLSWLDSTDRTWLVVLDDLAEPGDARGLWPQGRSGRVVVTTRRRDVVRVAGARLVTVGVFTPAESMAYLQEKLTTARSNGEVPADVLDAAEGLARDVVHLPVALAQAAAVIADEGITSGQYRARFADHAQQLGEVFPADVFADEYERTVATTWSLAIDRADRLRPAGLARPALVLAALLDSNGAPELLWATSVALESLQRHRTVTAKLAGGTAAGQYSALNSADARAALRTLHRLSLISHDPDGGPRGVSSHALIQRAALEELEPDVLAGWVNCAAGALIEVWPEVENDPALAQALRASADAVASRDAEALWSTTGYDVLFRAGRSLGEAGLLGQAEQFFIGLADTARSRLGSDHLATLKARSSLARWRGQAGDAASAAAAAAEALDDHLRVLGPDHPQTLSARSDLAYWQGQAGDPAGAADAFAELLTDRLRVLGPDHPDTLITRHNLARWRGQAGDPGGAAAAFRELLADRLRVLGPDHPDTLNTQASIAHWLGHSGHPADAAAAFQAVLTDRLRVLGPDHPDTLSTRVNLTYWRREAGELDGAIAATEEVLKDQVRVLGPDHPHTLDTRANLANWRGEAGDAAGAAVAYQELLTDRIRLLGPEHPHTLATHANIAHWLGQARETTSKERDCPEIG